jgi:hypothetical protein
MQYEMKLHYRAKEAPSSRVFVVRKQIYRVHIGVVATANNGINFLVGLITTM